MDLDGVGPELWARFAKLEQCCHVHSSRVGEPRVWQVVVGNGAEHIRMQDVVLGKALERALRAAEESGWA